MEYRILGPLEVSRDGVALTLGGVRQQRILATLVLNANRAVSVSRLATAAWGEDPPATARRQVQNRIASLRAVLAAAGAATALTTTPGGYRLSVDPVQVDAVRFERLGRDAADPSTLRQALALWRGPALAGLGGEFLEREAAVLEEKRLSTLERCLELEVAAGQPVIAELTALVREHPLRERPVALLMTALYRAGRQGEALAVYRDLAAGLAEELGLDPSAEVRGLHERILRADPGLDASAPLHPALPAPPVSSVPNHLPRPIADFTGRTAAVEELLRLASGEAVDVILIDGMAGAGKTALAVRVGHLLADRYPDGRLYVDLHGHSEREPVEPAAALDSLLRQLGVPAERVPDNLDDRSAMWRAELSGRRTLVVLDSAADSAQVLPLLGGGQPSLILVTTRKRLSGVDGAASVSLDVLSEVEAVALLTRVVGTRMSSGAASAAEVARLCGYLPLALRLAAARLAHRPQWSADDLVRRLREAHAPLTELAVQGRTVAAAFNLSYRQLDERARLVFRRLGLHPAGDFGEHAAAALTGLPLAQTRSTLEDLVDTHLLETPAPGRYRLHDLLRDYAVGLTGCEPAESEAALLRMCDYYARATGVATMLLERPSRRLDAALSQISVAVPAFDSPDEAMHALERERRNVLAAIRLATGRGWFRQVCALSNVQWGHLYFQGRYAELVQVQRNALAAATELGDPTLIGSAHNYLASAYWRQGRYTECEHHLSLALRFRRAAATREGQAATLGNFGLLCTKLGRLDEAADYFERAARIWLEVDLPAAAAGSELGLGMISALRGRHDEAIRYIRHSLIITTKEGKPGEVANSIVELGEVRLRLGHLRVAVLLLRRALRMKAALGDPYGEAEALTRLGNAYRALNRPADAVSCQRRALSMMAGAGMPGGECVVLNDLGTTLRSFGELDEAVRIHRRALEQAERIHDRVEQARAHDGLATACVVSDPVAARRHWLAALELLENTQLPERDRLAEKLAALDQGQLTHSSVPSAKT
jgi:DNA-binding SARP family transcriptional activator/tetratricopeptide (TPR) repeat protein